MDKQMIEKISGETIEKYRNYVNPGIANVLKFSGFDIPESHAKGCYIWDISGRKYLDCVGGYGAFSLGHLHPKVVEAVKNQLEKEALKSHFFLSTELAEACELMAEVLPGDIQYSFLCSSGTEAVEGALKCARIHTGRSGFIGAENSFHGKSLGSLSVSGREVYKKQFQPLLTDTKQVPYSDIDALSYALDDNTAAVILEVVQGEAGVNIPSDDYLPKVRELCTKNGSL
ncbi:MAG: aminotransferase class III-fold pyridoxal phosphate-dependent enzyme, partial [Armatimonadota bacterium]